MVSVAIAPQHLEAALAAGMLVCPDCCGRFSPLGVLALAQGELPDEVRSLRPRRAVCGGCPRRTCCAGGVGDLRRRDGAEVIGQARACKPERRGTG